MDTYQKRPEFVEAIQYIPENDQYVQVFFRDLAERLGDLLAGDQLLGDAKVISCLGHPDLIVSSRDWVVFTEKGRDAVVMTDNFFRDTYMPPKDSNIPKREVCLSFSEALDLLKQGMYLSREGWEDSYIACYKTFNGSGKKRTFSHTSFGKITKDKGANLGWQPDVYDLMADDWYVYDEL